MDNQPFKWWRSSRPLYSSPPFLRRSLEELRAHKERQRSSEAAPHCDRGRPIDRESSSAAARPDSNVISIARPRGFRPGHAGVAGKGYRVPTKNGRLGWAATVVALAVIFAGLVGASLHLPISRPQEYATRIGEQRTVRFPDGSTADLDGATRLRVRFSAHQRRIDLLQGQALFHVAKHPEPFLVVSGRTRVRDVGTVFDVNQMPSGAVVTVLEGRVEVTGPCSHPIELGPGQQVAMTCKVIPRRRRANLPATTAWTHHELIFDSTPLTDVAVEFNRFNSRQLVIEGTQLQSFKIGGVFAPLDPTSLPRLLQLLRAQPDIQVSEASDRIVVTGK